MQNLKSIYLILIFSVAVCVSSVHSSADPAVPELGVIACPKAITSDVRRLLGVRVGEKLHIADLIKDLRSSSIPFEERLPLPPYQCEEDGSQGFKPYKRYLIYADRSRNPFVRKHFFVYVEPSGLVKYIEKAYAYGRFL